MKISDCLKNEKFLCFVGGFLAATYGVKAVLRDLSEKLFRRIHANYTGLSHFSTADSYFSEWAELSRRLPAHCCITFRRWVYA